MKALRITSLLSMILSLGGISGCSSQLSIEENIVVQKHIESSDYTVSFLTLTYRIEGTLDGLNLADLKANEHEILNGQRITPLKDFTPKERYIKKFNNYHLSTLSKGFDKGMYAYVDDSYSKSYEFTILPTSVNTVFEIKHDLYNSRKNEAGNYIVTQTPVNTLADITLNSYQLIAYEPAPKESDDDSNIVSFLFVLIEPSMEQKSIKITQYNP